MENKNRGDGRCALLAAGWQLALVVVVIGAMAWDAAAYTIYLRNGKEIATEYCEQQGDMVMYEMFGGTISLQMNRVARLACDGPAEKKAAGPEGQGGEVLGVRVDPDRDLTAILSTALAPTTAIERANMSTLAIESPLGSGSGFFISPDGYILTNRHVVKFTAEMRQMLEGQLSQAREQLHGVRASFELERDRINTASGRIRREKVQLQHAIATDQGRRVASLRRSIRLQEESLRARKKSYERYLKKFRTAQQELQQQERDFRQKSEGMRGNRYYKIYLADGTALSAQLVKVSTKYDLALLRLDGYQTPALQVGAARTIPLGAPVYAIGNPVGRRNSISSGVLSARRHEFIQTNAEINPGNSGGPLISADGQVLGINTKKLVAATVEGMGFALDINYAFQEFADFIGGAVSSGN